MMTAIWAHGERDRWANSGTWLWWSRAGARGCGVSKWRSCDQAELVGGGEVAVPPKAHARSMPPEGGGGGGNSHLAVGCSQEWDQA